MYLKKLEVSGFKSFAHKTSLSFDRGISAVVGPNGSGKSNLADAVRWALGEQSFKALRSKKGEDIIFSGSHKKSQLGAATVSLYLDNRDKSVPIDWEEVVLTRKLFRDGQSEYLINKRQVRLMDVLELLAKSGMGQRGYSVISQGMVDAILEASPLERRAVFEEAAGVKQYQLKKQQTLRRLENTRQNLERVADLINEITPRLHSLKRQASKAAKKEQIEKKLTELQQKWFGFLSAKLEREREGLEDRRKEIDEKISLAQKELAETEKKLSQEQTEIKKDQRGHSSLDKKIEELQKQRNKCQKELAVVEGRIQLEKEKEQENSHLVPVDLNYIQQKLEDIHNSLKETQGLTVLEKIKKELKTCLAKLDKLFSEIKKGRLMKQERLIPQTNLEKLRVDEKELKEKLKDLEEKLNSSRTEIRSISRADQKRRENLFSLESQLRSKQDELNRLKDSQREFEIEGAKINVREEDLEKQITASSISSEIIEKGVKVSLTGAEEEKLARQIEEMKFKLVQIGGIDPLTIKEYQETEKRHQFLSEQSEDLKKAVKSLKKIILELDQKIARQFNEAFQNINREFNKYFKIIFGGGQASLKQINLNRKNSLAGQLIEQSQEEEENSLENHSQEKGIEVKAAPPGKKIRDLSMLSGGEKALTSIAILFAIISNNPSPFSILDEIDAALDEANSRRFAEILKELSSKSQFITITHNRETMRYANSLYGVTMGDDGISRLLSLRLKDK